MASSALPLLLPLLALGHLSVASAASLEALRAAARSHSLDAWCMTYRCPGPAYACATDAECRKCIACLHGCGSAQACSAGCLYRCGAEQLLSDFLSCAVVRHNCIQLQKPADGDAAATGNEADCNVGGSASLPIWGPPAKLSEVSGRWFAFRGGDSFHDCHPCRSEMLEPEAGRVTGTFLFDGAPVVHTRQVLESWPENGTLLLGLSKVGHDVTEVWRISWPQAKGQSEPSKNELMLSYCGNAGVWSYRGRLLLTRRPNRRGAPPSAAERRLSGDHAAFSCSIQHGAECRRLLPDAEAELHFSDEL